MASIIKSNTYADFNGREILTANNEGALTTQKILYPAFEAFLSSDQGVSDGSQTRVECDTEVYDIGGYYDNATNYRYKPLVAGKYFVYGQVGLSAGTSADFNLGVVNIRKNNSQILYGQLDHRGEPSGFASLVQCSGVIDMNGSTDYLELFGYIDGVSAGSESFLGNSSVRYTSFGAYRIGS